jgi:hypothetical protein
MSEARGESGGAAHEHGHDDVESYGTDPVQARHGRVDYWLLVVYTIMCIWALYYGITYWGGLGPGLDY